jgi:hypothetical protein
MKKATWMCVGVLALVVFASAASAGVVLVGDATFGADSVIRDTTNSREFLELAPTTPLSYDGVVAQLGPGGQFDGWSVASQADLDALTASAGIVDQSTDAGVIAKAEQLRDWLGEARTTTVAVYCRGLLSDAGSSPGTQAAYHIGRYTSAEPDEAMAQIGGFRLPTITDENVYLVRDVVPVPEPAGLGLIGLVTLIRRKRSL